MFVTALRGGASGWVDDDTLMYPDSMRRPTAWSYNVPIVAPDPLGTLAEPIFPNGQIVLFSGYYRARLRTLPDAKAPLVRRLTWRDRSLYVVHGRSADGEWSYVSQLNGDLKGWIYRWYAWRSLPILESVENPTLSPPPTPILEMPATVRVNLARLRRQPSGYYPVAVWIPRGTELVITGRSVFDRDLLTVFEGEVGWVAVSELSYEGDITLLPIWSLRW
jgi:hypothetical protein